MPTTSLPAPQLFTLIAKYIDTLPCTYLQLTPFTNISSMNTPTMSNEPSPICKRRDSAAEELAIRRARLARDYRQEVSISSTGVKCTIYTRQDTVRDQCLKQQKRNEDGMEAFPVWGMFRLHYFFHPWRQSQDFKLDLPLSLHWLNKIFN